MAEQNEGRMRKLLNVVSGKTLSNELSGCNVSFSTFFVKAVSAPQEESGIAAL